MLRSPRCFRIVGCNRWASDIGRSDLRHSYQGLALARGGCGAPSALRPAVALAQVPRRQFCTELQQSPAPPYLGRPAPRAPGLHPASRCVCAARKVCPGYPLHPFPSFSLSFLPLLSSSCPRPCRCRVVWGGTAWPTLCCETAWHSLTPQFVIVLLCGGSGGAASELVWFLSFIIEIEQVAALA